MHPDGLHQQMLKDGFVLVPAGRETKKLPFGDFCRPASHFRLGRCCRVCQPSGADIVKRFVNSSLGVDIQDSATNNLQDTLPRISERQLRRVQSQLANS